MSRPRVIELGEITSGIDALFQIKLLRSARPDDVVLYKYRTEDLPASLPRHEYIDVDEALPEFVWRYEFADKFSLRKAIDNKPSEWHSTLTILVERTRLHSDPLEWFSEILNNTLMYVRVDLDIKSEAARRLIPRINPKWHSLRIYSGKGDISWICVQFSAFPEDQMVLHEGYGGSDSTNRAQFAYENTRLLQRSVVVLVPVTVDVKLMKLPMPMMTLAPYDRLFLEETEIERSEIDVATVYCMDMNCETALLNMLKRIPKVLQYPMPIDMYQNPRPCDTKANNHLDETVADRVRTGTRCDRKLGLRWAPGALIRGTITHADILNACIALAAVGLTPYVLNWIVEWLPDVINFPEFGRMRHINKICASIRGVYQRRKVAL